MSMPVVFVSHGSPTLPTDPCPAREFLAGLGASLGRPSAILAISAHWEAAPATVSGTSHNATIHDFYGFPRELYDYTYPAPGDPRLAAAVAERLTRAGIPCHLDSRRGLDHGAWIPLLLMYPQADIPVLQLSLLQGGSPEEHFKLGTALRGLDNENVLVMGSGSLTHNLQALERLGLAAAEPQWVSEYADWMDKALRARRLADLFAYRQNAPYAARNHPTEDHILPLFAALGASPDGGTTERLHTSATFGALRMDAYAFR